MVSQLNPFEDQNQLGQQGLEGGDLSQRQADGSLEQGVGGAEDITRSLERVAAAEAWLSSGQAEGGIDAHLLGDSLAELSIRPEGSGGGSGVSCGPPKTLVALDTRVSNWQELTEELPANADLLLLDDSRSGLDQIKDALKASKNSGLGYASLAIVGNQEDGGLQLGSDSLSAGEADLGDLGGELIGDARIKLFSDAIAPAQASEPTSNAIATEVGESASELLVEARLTLRTAVANGTAETAVNKAFDEANRDAVSAKLQQFLDGKATPEIKWASFDASNVQGAFIASTNTILISENLKGSEAQTQGVVLEEIGHWLESEQASDSKGDEGELFAKATSEASTNAELTSDQKGFLGISGTLYGAEFSTQADINLANILDITDIIVDGSGTAWEITVEFSQTIKQDTTSFLSYFKLIDGSGANPNTSISHISG